MAFDFSRIRPEKAARRPVDPIELFQSLRVSDAMINDLWLAQGDALRGWHEGRTRSDVAVSLNTGAGKTLVGLLIAQSLVNETRGRVLYACSSIQLVRQTEGKARGYGLPVTTYVARDYSNDLSARGEAPCVTTYQALFNGKSVFFREEIAGIIFDDAHTAEHLLRDHFSLHIDKERFGDVYRQILAEFADYFHSTGRASTYEEIIKGESQRLLLIPPFEVKRSYEALLACLHSSNVADDASTTFAWSHLKDQIDLCVPILSSSCITFTPAFVPVQTLRYFESATRRVYLSATLAADDAFARTFGRLPVAKIAPTTTAGECERMILIPSAMPGVVDDLVVAKDAIRPQKALVLVPNYSRARAWADLVAPPPRERATEAIEGFKSASGNEKLLVAARYDGVDLPGDMCRVVVIDDLPMGTGPLERFLWEYLRLGNTLRSTIACRVVQSFGRISRGMSDHGVAVVTGRRLVEWLRVPKNANALPVFLQKQLHLGFRISESMQATDVPGAVAACLGRDPHWIESYESFIRDAEVEEILCEPDTLSRLALAEAKFGELIWKRDYAGAVRALRQTLADAANFSLGTVSWHKLWLGFALELSGDLASARALYQQAHAAQHNIPPVRSEGLKNFADLPDQAIRAALQFELTSSGQVKIPQRLERDLAALDGSGTVPQTEEALRSLGQYLGLDASRPDKEHGTGPDVLWIIAGSSALCLDAKTEKDAKSVYRKEELGQLSDHVQWVSQNRNVTEIVPGFVGPENPASDSSTPAAGVKVGSLEKFHSVAQILVAVCRDAASNALPLTLNQYLSEQFEKRGLLWPELRKTLDLRELRELRL